MMLDSAMCLEGLESAIKSRYVEIFGNKMIFRQNTEKKSTFLF